MKKTKEKNKKILSTFEENMVWMSYRYCVGRKTGVSQSHAFDLMKYVHNRLEPARREFMAIDVYRSMQTCFYPYFTCMETACDIYKPVNYIIDYIIKYGLDTTKVVSITQRGNNQPEYSVTEKSPDVYGMETVTFIHDLCDIIPWQRFAEVLGNDHKIVTTKYKGKVETWECIESYRQFYNEEKKPTFEKVYVSINENGAVTENSYLAPEYIIKVENKPKENNND